MKKKIKFMSLKETFRRDIKGNKKRERLYNIERAKLKTLKNRLTKLSAPYEKGLVKRLKNPKYAAEYLMACLESKVGNTEELFLVALRDIAKAYRFRTVAKRIAVRVNK